MYKDAHVLIVNKKISTFTELIPILEHVKVNGLNLLVIADDIDSEALTPIVINRLKGGLNVCCVKSPSFGDNQKAILNDIATVTGATVISEELGM